MKRKNKALIATTLICVLAMFACVATQAFVGIDYTYQDAHVRINSGDTGWALWVDYYDNQMQWHGPKYSDFYVYWNIPYFDTWFGVFAYNASSGYYHDVLFQTLTY